MIRFRCTIVLTFFLVMRAFADAPAEQSTTIPLDQIWGLDMPGTRNLTELEPEAFGREAQNLPGKEGLQRIRRSLISEIQRALQNPPADGQKAEPCFAVVGVGRTALEAAHAVIVKHEKAKESFPNGSDISLVVFSRMHSEYVHLQKVERNGDVVIVRFLIVPHLEREMTDHLAIIPLGKLTDRKVRVEIVKAFSNEYNKLGVKPRADIIKRLICQPCSFTVKKFE